VALLEVLGLRVPRSVVGAAAALPLAEAEPSPVAASRDKRAPGINRLTSAGSDYALYPAPEGVVKPADEWNSSRVVARGAHVEHWLNGTKLLEYEVGSPDWEKRLKASKFATWTKYGRLPNGHIGIQGDHEGELAIRNMKIRVLP